MNIAQLKQLIANMPDEAKVLMLDRDTVNPVESVIPFNVIVDTDIAVESSAYLDEAMDDLTVRPTAALVLVCNL